MAYIGMGRNGVPRGIGLPMALIGLFILVVGSDLFSWANTEQLTRPLLGWLYPERNHWGITLLTFQIRKPAHVVLYGLLAILIVRVIAGQLGLEPWRAIQVSFLIVLLLACADETQQWLRPNRSGSLTDVGLDALAAGGGLLIYGGLQRVRRALRPPATYARP